MYCVSSRVSSPNKRNASKTSRSEPVRSCPACSVFFPIHRARVRDSCRFGIASNARVITWKLGIKCREINRRWRCRSSENSDGDDSEGHSEEDGSFLRRTFSDNGGMLESFNIDFTGNIFNIADKLNEGNSTESDAIEVPLSAKEDGWGEEWEEDWLVDGFTDGKSDKQWRKGGKKAEKDPRAKRWGTEIPRDTWLRPISDPQGIFDRVTFDEEAVEDRIASEFEANRRESRAAMKFVAFIVCVPLVTGYVLSRGFAGPIWDTTLKINPDAFAMTFNQKLEGAKEIHLEETRIRLEETVGRAPTLTDQELLLHLAEKAGEIQEQKREENKIALLNVVSDSMSATIFFVILVNSSEGRDQLFATLNRLVGGLSDTAKAFLIILFADILLGYHSEEGWTALIRTIQMHYGFEPEDDSIAVFVAVVPVFLDACFKYWIFKGLNRTSPGAAVTLKTMDRH